MKAKIAGLEAAAARRSLRLPIGADKTKHPPHRQVHHINLNKWRLH
jgi:hypothetical protein